MVKRKDKKKPLGECEVTPSGMGEIISLTINEIYLTSYPIAFGKWIANIKNHIALFALLHFGGGKCRKCSSAKQKNDIKIVRILRNLTFLSANFNTPASDAGEKKKEEKAGYNPAEQPRKKNLRKKNLPARIIEQAGVPKDRVIGLSRKRILIAHIWSMLF